MSERASERKEPNRTLRAMYTYSDGSLNVLLTRSFWCGEEWSGTHPGHNSIRRQHNILIHKMRFRYVKIELSREDEGNCSDVAEKNATKQLNYNFVGECDYYFFFLVNSVIKFTYRVSLFFHNFLIDFGFWYYHVFGRMSLLTWGEMWFQWLMELIIVIGF